MSGRSWNEYGSWGEEFRKLLESTGGFERDDRLRKGAECLGSISAAYK